MTEYLVKIGVDLETDNPDKALAEVGAILREYLDEDHVTLVDTYVDYEEEV